MTILRESMTKGFIEGWMVRVWREEVTPPPFDDSHLEIRNEMLRLRQNTSNIWEFAEALLQTGRVNAVEVVHEEAGIGQVLYKDWP